ncbi:MAG: DUF362 domain-containing protein [Acidobacteriota bacterium]|nr:DUF362 domain-containing protein [Acidobacteriota bacterium]
MSKVFVVHGIEVLNNQGELNQKILDRMFHQGLCLVTGNNNIKESIYSIFNEREKVGIKINTIGGKKLSTRQEVSLALANLLCKNGLIPRNVIIWDRTNRELKQAGYRLNQNHNDIQIFGTDTQGVGYYQNLISHKNIGSLFSSIQYQHITSSISLAVLKDHGLAGITAGMKNYFGAIHNPNKYHDSHCNPYIPELFQTKYIHEKHKISILDALTVQYHRGPSFHAKWAKIHGTLIFSLDAVAADFVGWQLIEKLRAEKGLPSLKEEGREPCYLKTAEEMALGTATQNNIQIIEAET